MLPLYRGTILVPQRWDVEGDAYKFWARAGRPPNNNPLSDWVAAEHNATRLVASHLYYAMRHPVGMDGVIWGFAECLVHTLLKGWCIWFDCGGMHKRAAGPKLGEGFYLRALGHRLIGDQKGGVILAGLTDWNLDRRRGAHDQEQPTTDLAYWIFEAQHHRHGHDWDHWQLAQWLLSLFRLGRKLWTQCNYERQLEEHVLTALITKMIDEPDLTHRMISGAAGSYWTTSIAA
jgi:hypothetical protein